MDDLSKSTPGSMCCPYDGARQSLRDDFFDPVRSDFFSRFPMMDVLQSTSPDECQLLLPDIHGINRICFSEDSVSYLEPALAAAALEPRMYALCIRHQGQVVGYSMALPKKHHKWLADTHFYELEVGYMAMSAILPDFHGVGIYRLLNLWRLQHLLQTTVEHVFVRTQNPKVFMGIESSLKSLVDAGLLKRFELCFSLRQAKIAAGVASVIAPQIHDDAIPYAMRDIDARAGDIGVFVWQIVRS